MTTDENPADTAIEPTEFARQIMKDVYGYRFCASFSTFQDGESEPNDWCLTHDQSRRWCRQYQDEILTPLLALIEARDAKLADPADRDERFAEAVAKVTPCTCSAQRSRAERAEAELSNMEADYDRRGERLWRLAAKAGHEPHESDNDATAELAIHAELDRLRAQVAAVRAAVGAWAGKSHSGYYDEAQDDGYEIVRAALDTAGGEQQ